LSIELAYAKYTISGNFAFNLGVVSAFCTAFYSWRLIFLTFFSTYRGSKIVYNSIHEAPLLMLIPLVVLAFGSVFSGILLQDLFVGLGSDFFQNVIFVHPKNFIFF
jgi:NADH:ubiquinone oxidoreductase subunit 5 (subunit L)/multisubunit Na+/H+ antiporter MnhA subunit